MAISDILASIDHDIAQLQQARTAGRGSAGGEEEGRQTEENCACTPEGCRSGVSRYETREKEEEKSLFGRSETYSRGCQKALGGGEGGWSEVVGRPTVQTRTQAGGC
jgi:hypothetical protein